MVVGVIAAASWFACEPPDHNGPVNASVTAGGRSTLLSEPLLSGGRAVLELTHTRPGDWDFRETRLLSSDPDVIGITSIVNTADESIAQLVMGRPGPAVVTLLDADGEVLAELPAEVVLADRLGFTVDAISRPPLGIYIDSVPGLGTQVTVEVGAVLRFDAFAHAGSEAPLGAFGLTMAVLEPGVSPEDRLAPFDPVELAAGQFTVEVTAGDHDIYFSGLGTGATGAVRVSGGPPPP